MYEPSRCLDCGKRLVVYRMINGRTELECIRCTAPTKTDIKAAMKTGTTTGTWADSPRSLPIASDPAEAALPALAPSLSL